MWAWVIDENIKVKIANIEKIRKLSRYEMTNFNKLLTCLYKEREGHGSRIALFPFHQNILNLINFKVILQYQYFNKFQHTCVLYNQKLQKNNRFSIISRKTVTWSIISLEVVKHEFFFRTTLLWHYYFIVYRSRNSFLCIVLVFMGTEPNK